jgi:hypothetical protein
MPAKLSSFMQISVAVAIAVVTRQALWHYSGGWRWAPSWWAVASADNVCLMSPGRWALAAAPLANRAHWASIRPVVNVICMPAQFFIFLHHPSCTAVSTGTFVCCRSS